LTPASQRGTVAPEDGAVGEIERDRFGNPLAPGLPYARGTIVTGTQDDLRKLRRAWALIETRVRKDGPDAVLNFTGLERSLTATPSEVAFLDDELAPALYGDRIRTLALEHLGGRPERHDVMLFNRMTAATLATHLVLVRPGDAVIGVSPSYTHPTVVRSAALAGARFVDTVGADAFAAALAREERVGLVVLTRLAVSYDALPAEALTRVVALARARGVPVYVDDAGGARVGPAVLGQPRMLELGVDAGATGLDKYGTVGPRLGLLAGETSLVGQIRARAFELGLEARPMLYPAVLRSLEQYAPERVRALVATTMAVADALTARLGDRVHRTPVTAQLRGEDILESARERAGLPERTLVPIEATAALAMLLLEDHGILTVHFAGVPPGTSAMLFKFVPPETLARFGGAAALARSVDGALDRLASLIGSPDAVRALLYG
jgi:L-seryl-tRNA(Ser) seleniumtransferase